MFRTIQTGGWLAGAVCLLLSTTAGAELPPAIWGESITLILGDRHTVWSGSNADLPESHSEEIAVANSDLIGALNYYDLDGPQITARADGGSVGYDLSGEVIGTLTFQFQVVETSPPPLEVTEVPVIVTAMGSAEGGTAGCAGYLCNTRGAGAGTLTVRLGGAFLVDERISSSGVKKDLIVSKLIWASPNQIFDAFMRAHASVTVSNFYPSGSATATSIISPIVMVNPEFIPTTNVKYSDVYKIEFSPGYWALGNPTPVTSTSWGRIKSLYSDGR